jgi:spore germination cell wall hydrolase CwlJ-like protein
MYSLTRLGTLLLLGIVSMICITEYKDMKNEIEELKQKLEVPAAVKTGIKIRYTKLDKFCLAKNIYHEAGVEPYLGKLAVAQVTLNRQSTGRWGHDICSVVMSPSQFSWTLEPWKKWVHPKGKLWDESMRIAEQVLDDGVRLPFLHDSLYFHADYVQPKWRLQKIQVAQIGAHIFYRYPLDKRSI